MKPSKADNIHNNINNASIELGKGKSTMKKNIIITAIIAMLFVSAFVLTSCGDAVSGTWYYIKDASEASYYNMEFKSGNEVINEGVSGGYELDGNTVYVDFFGVNRTYEIAECDGVKVLAENGYAKWARTLEGAKQLNGSK